MSTKLRRELVEAGAGCGKTYSIISRFIEALGINPESGAPLKGVTKRYPKDIIALTFTEAAATQMKERLQERLESLGLPELAQECLEESQISTFHSLCYKLIKEQLPLMGYESKQLQAEKIVRELRQEYFLKQISESSETLDLLKWCQLSDLLELCHQHFFSSGDILVDEWKENIFRFHSHFEDFVENTREELIDALSPEILEKNSETWPVLLLQILESKNYSHCAQLNFVKQPKKFNKTHPELHQSAQILRDLARKGFIEGLNKESLEKELEAYKKILSFIEDIREGCPKYLDFAALEFELLSLIEKNPQSCEQNNLGLIIVDEFQDTNFDQFKIISSLSNKETEWYFVGDPKQSIYAFRGADIRLYEKLKKELTLIELNTNWRSEEKLLDLLNTVQEKLFLKDNPLDPSPQSLRAAPKDDPSTIIAHSYFHTAIPKELIFEECFQQIMKRQEQEAQAEHGVLFQSWKKLNEFADYLKEQNCPYKVIGQESYFDHPLTELFSSYLFSLINKEHPAFELNKVRWNALELKKTENCHENWSQIFLNFCLQLQPHRWKNGLEWTAVLSKQIQEWESESLPLQNSLLDFYKLIGIHRYDGFATPPVIRQSKENVFLMTIHGSKGLEFDHVYLPDLYNRKKSSNHFSDGDDEDLNLGIKFWDSESAKLRPSLLNQFQKRKQELKKEAETKRLLYVALTRASKSVDIFFEHRKSPRKKALDSGIAMGWPLSNTFYWDELLLRGIESFSSDTFSIKVFDQKIEASEKGDSFWEFPKEESQHPSPLPPYYVGSVSGYIRSLEDEPEDNEKTFTSFKSQPDSEEFGNQLHSALQIWNGQNENIEKVIDPHYPKRQKILNCLQKARKLPVLEDYWLSLDSNPENVFSELELLMSFEEYELSGTADALYIKDETLTLIDWKSSSSEQAFKNKERIEKIRKQLRLYARAFENLYSKIKIQSVAFFPAGQEYQAECIIDENY